MKMKMKDAMLSLGEIDKRDIAFVIRAHMCESKKPKNMFRRCTEAPYYVHPFLCAAMVLAERSESVRHMRREYALTLLYHDVLEDTNAKLPQWLSERVAEWVREMTLPEGSSSTLDVWNRPKEIRLLRLYDGTGNLTDMECFPFEDQCAKAKHITRLCEDVESHFGKLMIISFAREISRDIIMRKAM